jgi:hypothetical protein
VARVSNTTPDQTGAAWSVSVDGDGTYNGGANSGTASATGAGLGTAVYVWRLTVAVVATSTSAIGSACPASNKTADAGTTRVITICGSLSGSTAEVPGSGSPASLGGTLLSGIGSYAPSSASITPPATNRVVANWTGNTIGSPGGGKTLIARLRSNTTETSPLTTFTGYQSTSAPTATNDSVTVVEDSGASTIDVLANDTDADGDALSVVPSSGTTPKGSFSCTAANCVYTPNPNENGSDSFGYTITDGSRTASATLDVMITPANDRPVADEQSVSVDEDQSTLITLAGGDVETASLTYLIASLPGTGKLFEGNTTATEITTADHALPGDEVTYVPDPNSNGDDSFTFKVNDGALQSDPAMVDITVDPVNDAPVCTGPYAGSTDEDAALDGSVSCTDVDGDSLTYSVVSGPANGGFGGSFAADGSFTYTPDSDFNGSDSFTFTATDGTADSADATFDITVDSVNDAPVAADDDDSTSENTSVTTDVLANDSDAEGDALSVAGVSDGSGGTTTLNPDNTVTYTPGPGFTGTDSYTYDISDGNGGTDSASVAITVSQQEPGGGGTPDEDTTPPVASGGADAGRISPNRDGKFDEMNVSADFSEESSWTLSTFSDESSADSALSLLGVDSPTPVYTRVGLGARMEHTWAGVASDGVGLPEGSYRWELSGEDDAGNPMVGLEGSVRLDLTAPVLTRLKATPRRLRLKSHRRTSKRLVIRHALSEAGTIKATVLRKRRVVKRLKLATLGRAGTAYSVWNGRVDRGKRLRSGRYRVVLRATDLVANRTVHRGLTFKVMPPL